MAVTFGMAVVFAAHLWDSTDPFISYLLYPTKVITVLVLTTMGLFMDAIDSDMVIENPFAMTVIEASIGLFGFILLIVIDVIIMPYYLNRGQILFVSSYSIMWVEQL